MNRIEKKVWKKYFSLIISGKKNYELRLNDFVCREGDILVLREWDEEKKEYTGRAVEKTVTYVGIIKDMDFWKKEDIDKFGFQILSLK